MSKTNPLEGLNDCGCCEGLRVQTPVAITNPPGLNSIAYRVGTHAQFKQSLLARLSAADLPALQPLQTRDDDDFAIALLDAWAMVADVLTFYQERIANESYLRTATEPVSLRQLARLIGYELRPGVAASTYLAFTLEEAPGAPEQGVKRAPIDIGTKVQSLPGPGENPQTFETIEKIEARTEWNALKPKLTRPQILGGSAKEILLKGTATGLKAGDGLLFSDASDTQHEFRLVQAVTPDFAAGVTRVVWVGGPLSAAQKVYALRQRAALFGHNAPDWRAMAREIRDRYLPTANGSINKDSEWPGFSLSGGGTGLYGRYYAIPERPDLEESRLLMTRTDEKIKFDWKEGSPDPSIPSDKFAVRWIGLVEAKVSGEHQFFATSDDGVRLWVNNEKLIDEWKDRDATTEVPSSKTIKLIAGQTYPIQLDYYEHLGAAKIELWWSAPGLSKDIIPQSQFSFPPGNRRIYLQDTLHLDAVYPQIIRDSWLVLSVPDSNYEVYQIKEITEEARNDFMLSAKTTRLKLVGKNLRETFNLKLRETVVFAQSELLDIAEAPNPDPITGASVTLDRRVDGLTQGQWLIVEGKDKDGKVVSEVVSLSSSTLDPKNNELTTLYFSQGLQNAYQRDSVTIYANVARATHGETTSEVLGSGDATQPYQRFTLRQAPLTYTSAPTPSGAESTLQVRVNDVLWHEAPTLYGRGPRERVFVTRTSEGKTTIEFGDGQTGARLPSGQENVRATYRKGIGREGQVKAGQISLLMSRPLGVKGVINPQNATGAQDPEKLADARRNAPLTIQTLNRLVSLQDYEDFALAFSGMAKALATWTWSGQGRGVFITVAGLDGAEVSPDSALYRNLLIGMQNAGDPYMPLRVQSYRQARFRVAASIKVDPDYLPERVLAEVAQVLRSRFSFAARAFGQPVLRSEVIAVMQAVPGVVAVDLNSLYRTDKDKTSDAPEPNSSLPAELPQAGAAGVVAAELLVLAPEPPDLRVMS